jgi:hypothetical protein
MEVWDKPMKQDIGRQYVKSITSEIAQLQERERERKPLAKTKTRG